MMQSKTGFLGYIVCCTVFSVPGCLTAVLLLVPQVAVRESGMKHIYDFVSGPLLYGSTFMLGLLLGVLCDHICCSTLKFLNCWYWAWALLLSGISGIIGGYIMYFIKRAITIRSSELQP